jgi:hypothetical protein
VYTPEVCHQYAPIRLKQHKKLNFVFSAQRCAAEEKFTAPQRDHETSCWAFGALLRRIPKYLCAA